MHAAKVAFIWGAMAVFIAFSIIGALGAFGVIQINGWATAGAIIGPCLGICSTIVGAKHLFNDPEAVTDLKDKHADAVRELKTTHSNFVREKNLEIEDLKAGHNAQVDQLKMNYQALEAALRDEIKKERDLRLNAQDALRRSKPAPGGYIPGGVGTSHRPNQA